MASVDKTWVFASDNEGLADVGDSAIGLAHDASGNPGGSLEFTPGATGAAVERARRASTGETWETWGVPSGSTVTSVQIISWEDRVWNKTFLTVLTVSARIVNSSGTTVHTAGDLLAAVDILAHGSSWSSDGAGTSRAVDASYQASTTDVRLEVQVNQTCSSGTQLDLGIDNILLRITYTAGGGGATATASTLQLLNTG